MTHPRCSPLVVALAVAAIASSPAVAFKICIDPGHGGVDPGGVGCNLHESDANLDVARRLETLLQQNGFDVLMTRTDDSTTALQARTDFANANGVDRFVSIHNNAFTSASATGTETFCHTSATANSVDLRDRIQDQMVAAWGLTNRGGKTADFFVLRNTGMPATLSELGFVTNCSVDATLIADANHRQSAAQAHLEAIAAHLGVNLGTPVDTTGDLKGVVFADQGVGTADMSVRIGGAVVTVVQTGAHVVADAATGAWTFTLDPGSYTVRATAPGFITAEHTCDPLVAGDIRFCSIGLFAVPPAGEGEGEGEVVVGEGEGEVVVGEGEGEVDPGKGEGEGEPLVDGGSVDVTEPGLFVIAAQPKAQGGCTSTSSTGLLAVLSLALLGWRKKRAVTSSAALVLLCASGAVHAQEAAPMHTTNARQVLAGEFASVALSPSGEQLLLSDSSYTGLVVHNLRTHSSHQLTDLVRAGFRALWVDEAHVAHRLPKRPFDGDALVELDLQGAFVGEWRESPTVTALQRDGGVYVREAPAPGKPAIERKVSRNDDRCFGPVLSAAADRVSFQCLRTGLYVLALHGPKGTHPAAVSLGEGASPAFSQGGTHLVFARSTDDGHALTSSDIYLVTLSDKNLRPLRITAGVLARSPALSADASKLAYLTDAGVMLADLVH